MHVPVSVHTMCVNVSMYVDRWIDKETSENKSRKIQTVLVVVKIEQYMQMLCRLLWREEEVND